MDVKFQSRKEGGFKCKFEGAVMGTSPLSSVNEPGEISQSSASSHSPRVSSPSANTSRKEMLAGSGGKSVKFRIDVLGDEEDTGGWRVQFVQQQGRAV
jgi:hypothetical protein